LHRTPETSGALQFVGSVFIIKGKTHLPLLPAPPLLFAMA